MCESEKWKWSRSVVSDPQRPHGLQPTRLLRPWYFPGTSTGVGCHCLLRSPSCGPIIVFRTFPWDVKQDSLSPPSPMSTPLGLAEPVLCQAPPGLPVAFRVRWVFIPCSCSVISDPLRPHGQRPGSSVHRISQAKILEWIVISSSKGFSSPGDRTLSSRITGGFSTQAAMEKPWVSAISNISNYHQLLPSILFITCFLPSCLLPWFCGPAFRPVVLPHPHLSVDFSLLLLNIRVLTALSSLHTLALTPRCGCQLLLSEQQTQKPLEEGELGKGSPPLPPAEAQLSPGHEVPGIWALRLRPQHPFSCSGCLFASSWFSLFQEMQFKMLLCTAGLLL